MENMLKHWALPVEILGQKIGTGTLTRGVQATCGDPGFMVTLSLRSYKATVASTF